MNGGKKNDLKRWLENRQEEVHSASQYLAMSAGATYAIGQAIGVAVTG